MRSPVAALVWDYLWLRNRTLTRFAIGIIAFGSLLNLLWPPNLRASSIAAGMVNFFLATAEVLLLLAIFSYTELNPQRGTNGFPHRLFVLPVTTFRLVAIPMFLSVVTIEVGVMGWIFFVLRSEDRSIWIALQLGVFMALYQTVLWTLPSLKALRLLIIGLIGVFLIMLRIFPFVQRLPDSTFTVLLIGVAVAAFLVSWMSVALQRSDARLIGHSAIHRIVSRITVPVSQLIPRRAKPFSSPHAAQFWFEWRRSGSVLPVLVGSLLVLVIAPISWFTRDNSTDSLRIVMAVFAMPMLLALAVGKAFSKPDYWSKELSLPGFISVRPFSSADIVATKMKVAAVSAVVSWVISLTFLLFLIPRWANLDSLTMIRATLWAIHGHRILPQYAIAVLLVIAAILLTWRFLVGGLWLGLAGKTKVFAASALPYVLIPLLGVPLALIARQPILDWLHNEIKRGLPIMMSAAVAATVVKFWLAAFSWRNIKAEYVRRYLAVWFGSTACLIALSLLLSNLLSSALAVDSYRLRNVMILVALQIMPLASLGLAPTSLDKNRHQ